MSIRRNDMGASARRACLAEEGDGLLQSTQAADDLLAAQLLVRRNLPAAGLPPPVQLHRLPLRLCLRGQGTHDLHTSGFQHKSAASNATCARLAWYLGSYVSPA